MLFRPLEDEGAFYFAKIVGGYNIYGRKKYSDCV